MGRVRVVHGSYHAPLHPPSPHPSKCLGAGGDVVACRGGEDGEEKGGGGRGHGCSGVGGCGVPLLPMPLTLLPLTLLPLHPSTPRPPSQQQGANYGLHGENQGVWAKPG